MALRSSLVLARRPAVALAAPRTFSTAARPRAGGRLVPVALFLAPVAATSSTVALCAPKDDVMKQLQGALGGDVGSMATSASFGTIAGFSTGFVLKKLGRATAGVFGVLFMTFQLAAYTGYVEIKWDKVEKDIMGALDIDKDGKVDENDAGAFMAKTVNVLTTNTNISSGAFGAGVLLGFQRG